MRDPAHSNDGTRDQHNDAAEPPPPYQGAAPPFNRVAPFTMVAAFNLALAKKGLTKVAMLPWFGPSPRFQYISDCLGIRKHDYLLVQGSDYRIAEPVITYKLIKCTLNKYWATWKPKPKPDIHPFYDLGPNEIERVAQYQYDWTRDWDFVYSVRIRNFPGPGGNWMAEGCMYFKGSLSPADYIPWNDPVKTMRVEADVLPVKYDNKTLKRRFTWKFCERSDNPRWGASFTIFYEEGTIIPTFDNPWFIFSSASTKLADLCYRTGKGRFKMLMWYHENLAYGNDILDQPVEAWDERRHPAQYADFASRFLPKTS